VSLLASVFMAAASTCLVTPMEEAAQRALPYAAFDGLGPPSGWRVLAATGCTELAVSLLAQYLDANRSRLSAAEAREVAFHMGQTLAMAGREQDSIAAFERALDGGAPAEWATYVTATLAFVRRDALALEAARAAYASLAPGSMRLRIIEGLVACRTEPYMKAAHCRM
jgi:tetratricopeptide (TPR) repeat protein